MYSKVESLLIVCSSIVIFWKEWVATDPSKMTRIASQFLRSTLAENVRAFRKHHGYSQEELADRCGLHRTYIGSVEREERNVTLSTLEVLAQALEVSVPQLLTSDANNAPKNP